ncbi:MAG: cyclic nucleotide-binding domain-containing protein [Actinobacteria bacterium]|nr:cyclic nucleotide-binding domain-containing protein [Actinomycetota bacterium]
MKLGRWRERSPLFAEMDDQSFAFLESIAQETAVRENEIIFRVNTPADRFYLVIEGKISLRIAGPSRPPITIQTLGEGCLLGLSWRLPPYRWQWTAQALTDSKLAAFDARTVLEACKHNPRLDAALWRVVARESATRLQNARLQLLDLYGQE